jgi:MipA family protein
MRFPTILPAVLLSVPVLAGAQAENPTTTSTKPWTANLGIAAVAMPGYSGSNRYRIRPSPIIQVEYKERAYFGSSVSGVGGGVGVYMVRTPTLAWAAEVSSAGRRRESYGDGLAGMGTRSGGTMVGTNASYRVRSTTLGVAASAGLKDEGVTATVNLDTKRRMGRRMIASFATGATFSDHESMAFDFGVSPVQAIRRQALIASGDSRLSPTEGGIYAPKGGLKQAQVSTSLGYMLTKRTSAMAFVTGTRLGSEAAASPLTRQRNGLMGGLGMAFGI